MPGSGDLELIHMLLYPCLTNVLPVGYEIQLPEITLGVIHCHVASNWNEYNHTRYIHTRTLTEESRQH